MRTSPASSDTMLGVTAPTDPSILAPEMILGYPTADWALGVSVIAAILSAGSVLYARKSYRRSGAPVSLRIEASNLEDDPLQPVLFVIAENEGLAAVQVKSVYLRFKRMRGVRIGTEKTTYTGTSFFGRRAWLRPKGDWLKPVRIKGLSHFAWGMNRVGLLSAEDADRRVKIRGVVVLAGVGRVKSKWFRIEVTPTVEFEAPDGTTLKVALPLEEGLAAHGLAQAPPDFEVPPEEAPPDFEVPPELRERVERGEQSGLVDLPDKNGGTVKGYFVTSPAGWNPGDPLPPDVLEKLGFGEELLQDDDDGDLSAD